MHIPIVLTAHGGPLPGPQRFIQSKINLTFLPQVSRMSGLKYSDSNKPLSEKNPWNKNKMEHSPGRNICEELFKSKLEL